MRLIDGDVLKESLKESRDNCIVWLEDCKEARSQKWIGRAEQALMTFNECLMRIDTIPTIEPGQKTGKWVRAYDCDCLQCDQCGRPSMVARPYCCICGAKMEAKDD